QGEVRARAAEVERLTAELEQARAGAGDAAKVREVEEERDGLVRQVQRLERMLSEAPTTPPPVAAPGAPDLRPATALLQKLATGAESVLFAWALLHDARKSGTGEPATIRASVEDGHVVLVVAPMAYEAAGAWSQGATPEARIAAAFAQVCGGGVSVRDGAE